MYDRRAQPTWRPATRCASEFTVRGGELDDAIKAGTARVVEHLGKITGYATDVVFFAHAVAETNQGLKALIGAAPGFPGGGFLLPTRNGDLFRWCLETACAWFTR